MSKHYELTTDREGTWKFSGELLGASTSQSPAHNHPGQQYVSTGKDPVTGRKIKCSACRWQEASIYLTDDDDYILHTVGRTTIPGEIEFGKLTRVSSPMELLEVAVVRAAQPYIPEPTARALAQAADADDDLREAYLDARRVS